MSAPLDSAALLRRAADLHAEGAVAEAVALYRQIVSVHSEQPLAWALLGGALCDVGDNVAAVDALERAVALVPGNDAIAVEYTAALQAAGRFDDAIAVLSDRKVRLQDSERAQIVLADAYRGASRWDDAIASYQRVLALSPGNNTARIALGACQQQSGNSADAVETYRAAIALDPNADDAWSNLGLALLALGETDAALAAMRRAKALNPDDPATRCNLGVVLQNAGQLEEAAEVLESLVAEHPAFADGWSNLGNVRQDQCRLAEALAVHDRAVTIAPDNAEYHWNRAMTLLLSGKFAAGFAEYEWRARTVNHAPPGHGSPPWDGSDLTGRRLLLMAEQGFGDTIQFVRYASILQAMGADVTIQCPSKLTALFSTLPGTPQIVANGVTVSAVDCHAPLMSLPHLLGTQLGSIPGDTPYLSVPGGVATPPQRAGRRRVGLVWTGNARHPENRSRSISLHVLSPLLVRDDVEWVSLQFSLGSDQSDDMRLADWSPYLNGFADTASALSALDLVISVDTATAHLAGALGLPVWLMLKFSPDWRWMLARNDSPWYPTMRLFRQEAPGDWAGIVDRLGSALDAWMEN